MMDFGDFSLLCPSMRKSPTKRPVYGFLVFPAAKAWDLDTNKITAVFQAHEQNENRMSSQALLLPHFYLAFSSPDYSGLSVLPYEELMEKQRADNTLSRIILYVERGQRPSTRELEKEPNEVNKLLKDWDKVAMKNAVLYRVTRNVVTKRRSYLFVVPSSCAPKSSRAFMMRPVTRGSCEHCIWLGNDFISWASISMLWSM